jgi:hypothetical protein
MNAGGVTIVGSLSSTDRALAGSYSIENRTGEDVYVLDVMYRLPGPVLDDTLVYTILEADRLTLFRGVLRIPPGVQVEAPELPLARLLKAGASLTGKIDAPLPLRFSRPYQFNDTPGTRTAKTIGLRIGYVAARHLTRPPEAKKIGNVDVHRVSYRQVVDVQQFVELPHAPLQVQLSIKP